MLARMRSIEYVNQLFRYQVFDERPVDRHPAQGCLPSLSRAHRQSAEPDKVGGTKHDDTLYVPADRGEPGVGGGGDRSGIDVAGMWRDKRFRRRGGWAGSGAVETDSDLALKIDGSGRVEDSGDRGGTDGGQGLGLR